VHCDPKAIKQRFASIVPRDLLSGPDICNWAQYDLVVARALKIDLGHLERLPSGAAARIFMGVLLPRTLD
jgi:hypothetical protein